MRYRNHEVEQGARAHEDGREDGRNDGRNDGGGNVAPEGSGERTRRAVREASFLAEASRLLANSLDYETTLSTVAGLALPDLGAWCVVDVTEENGEIRRVAIVHPDPDKQELARELRDGWPPTLHDRLGVPLVARSLVPEIIPVVDDDLLKEMARGPRNLEILKRLGIGSLMTVPLAAAGDCLGAITYMNRQSGKPYDEDDLALAEDLANRAAIAIDNARLYRMARRAQEAAEMASRAKSQFLGVMSHELRTPINAILGYTQLLDMGVKGALSGEQRSLLSRIEASSRHLLDLVVRVLDVSRAEAGELAVSNEETRLNDVLTSTLQIVTQQAPEGVTIENACDGDVEFRFIGDGIRVRQILIHLVSNAFRFSEEGGRVVLRCESVEEGPGDNPNLGPGPWLRIDVEDNGVGIAADRIDAIFEPFVQADPDALTREADGSGLGLAIGRYLARLMGGDLTVTSEPGTGSTFSLWLAAPTDAGAERGDRRLFDRQVEGLSVLADHLLRRLKPIVEAYIDRLRHDGAVPRARQASDIELRNQIPHFIAGLSGLLHHAGHVGEDVSQVLRGGNAIQRTTLELHGAQRYDLGWSREDVESDLDTLRRTIHHDVRVTAPDGLGGGAPLDVLDRLFEQAEHITIQGWQHAESSGPDAVAAGTESRT